MGAALSLLWYPAVMLGGYLALLVACHAAGAVYLRMIKAGTLVGTTTGVPPPFLFDEWPEHVRSKVRADGKLRLTKVSNDMSAPAVIQELFEDEAYLKHGVELPTGDALIQTYADFKKGGAAAPPVTAARPFIIDVGGNIGLFTSFLMHRMPYADIVVCEPIPLLFKALGINTAAARATAAIAADKGKQQLGGANVEAQRVAAHCAAIGEFPMAGQEISLDFDPGTSAGATSMTEEVIRGTDSHKAGILNWVHALFSDGVRTGVFPKWCSLFGRMSASTSPLPFRIFALLGAFAPWLAFALATPAPKHKVAATVRPLSEVIAESEAKWAEEQPGLPAELAPGRRPIDMMKIDVEGAEWGVLMGISDADWDRTKQMVVEAHDFDGRVNKIAALLKAKGFSNVTIDREDLVIHDLLKIRTVFATR